VRANAFLLVVAAELVFFAAREFAPLAVQLVVLLGTAWFSSLVIRRS
jgi:hypothetical protein